MGTKLLILLRQKVVKRKEAQGFEPLIFGVLFCQKQIFLVYAHWHWHFAMKTCLTSGRIFEAIYAVLLTDFTSKKLSSLVEIFEQSTRKNWAKRTKCVITIKLCHFCETHYGGRADATRALLVSYTATALLCFPTLFTCFLSKRGKSDYSYVY